MKFRYDINALRAIAIVGVLLFHFKVPFFAGGFAGVDAFFVISGYLMSRIIINGLNQGDFSLGDFYGKRVKRIIPALLFLTAAISAVGFFLCFPNDYKIYEQDAAASDLFFSNILYWSKSNYFDPSSDSNILLHTWSLSVEWQFYLLYPLVLMGIKGVIKDKQRALRVFTIATLLLFALSVTVSHFDPTASFYLLPTRAWEMLFGGVAFLLEEKVQSFKYRKALAITGYLIIFACLGLLNGRMMWPGMYTFIPVAATLLVIIANANEFKILQSPVVQFIGKISYSLYLWHWPIYVMSEYYGIEKTPLVIVSMTALAVGLAYLSFKYIESIRYDSTVKILSGVGALTLVIGVLSFIPSNEIMFKPETLQLADYMKTHAQEIEAQFSTGKCFITSTYTFKDYQVDECLCNTDTVKNILLIGDSHAAQFSQALRTYFATKYVFLSQATASGCAPVINANGEKRCSELFDYVYYDYIANNADKIDGVIINANWADLKTHTEADIKKDISATLAYLHQLGIPVIIIGQNETYTTPYPVIAAREHELNISVSKKYLTKESLHINQVLKASFDSCYVDIYNSATGFPVSDNKEPYMFDQNHFSVYGADMTVQKIMKDPVAVSFLQAALY